MWQLFVLIEIEIVTLAFLGSLNFRVVRILMLPFFGVASDWRQRLGTSMALDAVEELSDGGASQQESKEESAASKAKSKAKAKSRPKAKGSKVEGKAKAAAKGKAAAAKGKAAASPKTKTEEKRKGHGAESGTKAKEKEKEEQESGPETTEVSKKKPAASTKTLKRPSASPAEAVAIKATKYLYHAEKKWGVKCNGREYATAGIPIFHQPPLSSQYLV